MKIYTQKYTSEKVSNTYDDNSNVLDRRAREKQLFCNNCNKIIITLVEVVDVRHMFTFLSICL